MRPLFRDFIMSPARERKMKSKLLLEGWTREESRYSLAAAIMNRERARMLPRYKGESDKRPRNENQTIAGDNARGYEGEER